MVLTITTGAAFSEPVSAASHDVDSSMSNADIQTIISSAGFGDTVNFLSGVYNSISFTVTNALNLVSNGAILNSNGNSTVLTLSGLGASGTNITGFTINGNGNNYGIDASNINNITILNNSFDNNKNAIYFNNVNESAIQSNNIYNNNNYGILISNLGTPESKNNIVIDDNQLINTAGGISVTRGSGFTVTNNYIDMNGGTNGALSGSRLYNFFVENNTFLNGKDGINVFQWYTNFTVNNNIIINMTRDGISFVNHNATNIETETSTTITNNFVQNNEYGLFFGGNFHGDVTGNWLDNSTIIGMQIMGKASPTQGLLDANITYNNITNAGDLGISMEHPNVQYLNLSNNIIDSDGYSIQYNEYFRNNGEFINDDNILSNVQNFIVTSTMNNEYIQSLIDESRSGDTITFLSGTYNDIALNINKALNLIGDDVILNNNGGSVISITGENSSGTSITGFTINANGTSGIHIYDSINNTIRNNIINGDGDTTWGICIENTNGFNNITDNSVSNFLEGINLYNTSGATIFGNTVTDCLYDGIALTLSTNNIITDNNGAGSASGIRLVNNSNGNTISNNDLTGNIWTSISLEKSEFNTITNNVASDNQEGMYLYSSNNNIISGNTANNNIWDGIALHDSSYNTIQENFNVSGNNCGIRIIGTSSDNEILNNTLNDNTWSGISLDVAGTTNINGNTINNNHIGVSLVESSDNTIQDNIISNNDWDGICAISNSNNNIITENDISNGGYGVRILDSTGNTVNENNFVNNYDHTYDNNINNWDNGNTGNYYNDWTTTDPRPVTGGSSIDNFPSTTPF